jgi:hypothetical protein
MDDRPPVAAPLERSTTMAARKKALTPITDPFRATGSALRAAAEAGDAVAQAELDRRAAKKAAAKA